MNKLATIILIVLLVAALTGCSGQGLGSEAIVSDVETTAAVEEAGSAVAAELGATDTTSTATQAAPVTVAEEYEADDLTAATTANTTISLQGDTIAVSGSGATVAGTTVTITAPGAYEITGVLNDGQIIVDTPDDDVEDSPEETVSLILNGADITSTTSAPIYVKSAEKVVITLAEGSVNSVTDGEQYLLEAGTDEPNAAIFGNDDLTINGSGSLTVNANYNNGIDSNDDLKITSGVITVNAVNDGIKGRDSLAILDGLITINAGGDGMQANNDEEADKGYVVIEGGTLQITAGRDGIQAETNLAVSGGNIFVVSGGGSASPTTSESAKGLKAGVDITISGGEINIDAADDAIHSDDSITISGGDLQLASGDDALHAEHTLNVTGGNVNVNASYEGIEGSAITISDGVIHVVSTDDGVNAVAAGESTSEMGPGGFEGGDNSLTISGGYLAVDALGDGLDINGPITMTGGVVIVNGPTEDMNGSLDYSGSFNISGGVLIAAGSAGMAMAPSADSSQNSLMVNFTATQAAGSIVHIETAAGEEILTFAPTKSYQSLVFSSPELVSGESYVVYTGGSSTGTVTDGVYVGGDYTPGVEYAELTLSGVVTVSGAASGGFPGGPGGFPGGPGGGQPGRP